MNQSQLLLEKALDIAFRYHKGQYDKAGQPYILHPLRMMFALEDVKLKTIALLHDLLEDTSITIDELRNHGFTEDVLEAVITLTKTPNEAYDDFIVRISNNALARQVKIADLKDNMDLTRLKNITPIDLERLQKYHNSLIFLEKAQSSGITEQ